MCHLLLNIFFYKIGDDWISGSYCLAFRDGQLVDATVSEVKKDPDGRPFAVIYFDDDAFNQYDIWLSELKPRGKIANLKACHQRKLLIQTKCLLFDF